MMLDTEELMPVGSTEGYRKNLTEMHAGGRGVEKLDTWQMQRFPNLEVLWLNDNKISKLQGLEYNFRLKHLYLQNNSITTLLNNSCCIGTLTSLETLQLACNQLQDMKATLEVLSKLRRLRYLSLHSNPLALEGFYRESVIFAIPTLEHLDASTVTPIERAAAVKLFTAKRIEKKYAFGTVPKIWEKPAFIKIGDPSGGELLLRKEIKANNRRRAIAAAERADVEVRETLRPRFDITYSKEATGLLSAKGGAPNIDEATFEFVARGRVPHLMVQLSFLSMTAAAKRVAAMLGEKGQGDGSRAKVHVAVTALGVQKEPLVSRDVLPSQLDSDDEAAFLRYEEFAFKKDVYADAFDKVQQAIRMGRGDQLSVTVMLRESSTKTVIGSARLPLLPILEEHVEKTYTFEKTPLMPPRRAAFQGLDSETPVGYLTVGLVTDWGLSNTNAGEFGNSAFEFVRRRKEEAAAEALAASAPAGALGQGLVFDGPPARPPPRPMARDRVYLTTSLDTGPSASADPAATPAPAPAPAPAQSEVQKALESIKFDAARYAEFEKGKDALKPKKRVVEKYAL